MSDNPGDVKRSRSGRARAVVGTDALLSSILRETAEHAAEEQESLLQAHRRRQEFEVARRLAQAEQKRLQAEEAVQRERMRLAEAASLRAEVRRKIEVDELHRTGEWVAEKPAAQTGELTPEQIRQAAANVRAQAAEAALAAQARRRRTAALAGAGAAFVLIVGLLIGALAGGPDIDPTQYPKTAVALVDNHARSEALAFRLLPERARRASSQAVASNDGTTPEADATAERGDRRSGRSERRRAAEENAAAASEEPAGQQRAGSRLDISLDGADDSLFARGSE